MDTPSEFNIKRKPLDRHVALAHVDAERDNGQGHKLAEHLPSDKPDDKAMNKISTNPEPDQQLSTETTYVGAVTRPDVASDRITLASSPSFVSETSDGPFTQPQSSQSTQATSHPSLETPKGAKGTKSFWDNAWDETRFFAGGLVSHPHESTKHYTILRHSPALVFYRGPTTSVAVTIFSSSQPDKPLPADRTIWLQRRGFSGNTGMKLKRLVGATGTWLDVTPILQASPEDVSPNDERGWQRDIAKLLKKFQREKSLDGQLPRETLVVRVPAAADDGYFRLLLCTGGATSRSDFTGEDGGMVSTRRRVLCSSPIFRVASTSADSSILRGAGLKTLPIELGVKIGSTIGQGAVMNLISPVSSTIQSTVQTYQPGFVATQAATTVYSASGLGDRLNTAGNQYGKAREISYDAFGSMEEGTEISIDLVGPAAGPEKPYPVKFQGRISKGPDLDYQTSEIRTAHLVDVPDDVRLRLRGVYMGWACILPSKGLKDISFDWHETVIIVGPSLYAGPSIVTKDYITLHIIHDFSDKDLLDAKVKIIVMGFLRPMRKQSASTEGVAEVVTTDINITLSSLSRDNWGPEMTLGMMKTAKSARSFSEKYGDARLKMQKRADSVPLHWAGIRTSGAELRDRPLGTGGFWIAR